MNFRLLKRCFRYLLPHLPLAFLGACLIAVLTVSSAVSLVMLKPVFDGILVKTKQELISSEKNAPRGASLAFVKDMGICAAHNAVRVVKREKNVKEAKTEISARFNNYLRTGSITDILVFISLFILIGVTVKTASDYARRIVFLSLNLRIMTRVRMDVYNRVMTFSMPFFNGHKTGYLMNRIIGEVSVIQDLIVTMASGILTNLAMVIFYFAMILYIDARLTLILILCFPPLVFLLDKLARYLKQFQGRLQELAGQIFSVAQETLLSIRLVIVSNKQAYESERYHKSVVDFQKLTLKMSRFDFLAAPISEFATTVLGLGIVLYALKSRVMNPDSMMTGGDFIVYIAFMFAMMKPIKDLNSQFVNLQRGLVVAGRVFEIIDMEPGVQETPGAVPLQSFQEAVEFRNVTFEYRPGAPVLRNISFTINKGDIVALVGPSGGGKTTLVDLLPRLYDPLEGEVRIDGRPVRDYTLASLRDKMGVVTQETILFHDTVRGNIAYGDLSASDSDVAAAAEVANATEFISELPQKYDTVIGDRGARLSGGQRQRLCIARAILRNPDILIFDEATSALDNESESKVQKAIDNLVKNRTAVVIAHRLSTIKHANKILVIENGQITEQGAHADLIAKNGTYKRLYDLQFRDAPGTEKPAPAEKTT